jgi:hypothetical protein
MLDTELFRKIHAQITARPETHSQDSFEWDDNEGEERSDGVTLCGTTRCVAGWALHFYAPEQSIYDTARELGEPLDLAEVAKELLGLTYGQAEELFSASLPESEAVALVARYAGLL